MIAKRLEKGDTIGVVAPSKMLQEKHILNFEKFRARIKQLGFLIKPGTHLYGKHTYGYASGTGKERAQDFNSMILDGEVTAVWLFMGGEVANEMLPHIDWTQLQKHPKILIGKSDCDLILMAANQMSGLVSFHGPDSVIGDTREFDYEYTQEWFMRRLVERQKQVEPAFKWKTVRPGICRGKLLGCNLNSILKLTGTRYFPDFTDSVLFLENRRKQVDLTVQKLEQLKQTGVFDKIRGIVIGHIHENRGIPKYEQIVLDKAAEYGFPILKIEEFGHYNPHAFLPIGAEVEVDATNKKIVITGEFLA